MPDQASTERRRGCRAIVLEVHRAADFLGHGDDIGQMEAADIEGGVELGIRISDVLDQHAVVQFAGGVFDRVLGLEASNRHGAIGAAIAEVERHGDIANRRVGGDAVETGDDIAVTIADRDAGDVGQVVVCVQEPLVVATRLLEIRGVGADHSRGRLGRCLLRNDEGRTRRAEESAKVDVVFDDRLAVRQAGHGVERVGVGHEGEDHPFARIDPLVVGADGRGAAALAGIDGVTRILAIDDLVRIQAGDDEPHVRAAGFEHQELVLPGRHTGEVEGGILAGGGPEVVRHVDHVVGVRGIRVLERRELRHPDLGAGCRLFQIGGENDGAARICHVVLGRVGGPLSAYAAQDDVVVGGVRVQEDSPAIEGIETAPVRTGIGIGRVAERFALGIGEGEIEVAAGDGDQVGTGVASGAGIATQRSLHWSNGAQQREQSGLERQREVVGFVGAVDCGNGNVVIGVVAWDAGCGSGVL